MVYLVTIKGTWSRTNTERHEVYWYRKRLRAVFRNLGGEMEFTLPHSQKDSAKMSGTFRLTLPIRSTGERRKDARVVKLLADAIILMRVCRPPKLSVDPNKTKTVRDDNAVGLLGLL